MFIATVVVSCVLAVALLGSGIAKLTGDAGQTDLMTEVGFPADRMWMLGACTVAGAVGLLVGLFWWPIGVAAAVGSLAYFLGALGFHLRSRRLNQSMIGAVFLTALSVAALALRLASA
ncbi:DoxX family protein [Streptomyces fulvoviolaceus]|uniref:DoxX family protein n=1 Tax=Streptomyces fulvoviolaceus TaxID=285535 RepID=UPI0004C8C570|nr:DoxX family protein [Streptomyces fulvoviolaceus]